MTAHPGGLAARIREDVDAGKPRDEIVAGLVSGGLTQASAERFVDRAIAAREAGVPAAPPPAAAPAARPKDDEDEEDRGGRGSLISGAFWLSVGLSVTGITYLLAKPGGSYMVAYGAMIGGLLAFGRGVKRFLDAGPMPFPWKAVAIAALVPFVGLAGLVGTIKWRQAARRADVREALEAQQEAKEAEARQADERAQAEAAAQSARDAAAARARYDAATVERHLTNVRNGTGLGCDSALELGRLGAREAIPELQARLADPGDAHMQVCAAGALADLGEIDGPAAFYAASTSSPVVEERRTAIMGLGKLGPRGAAIALPYLAAALQSGDMGERYVAVEALEKMGPAGVPYLRTAAEDADPLVKQRASAALASLGAR